MVGESNYTECTVKRLPQQADIFKKSLLILGAAVLAVAVLLFNGLIQILFITVLVLYFLFLLNQWSRFNVVYEYVFVDGQIDFDAIYSGSSRKNLKRIDMDKVDIVAPEGSHYLDGYKHLDLKPLRYNSGDPQKKPYVIMLKGNEGQEKILFEPDANFLSYMKRKSPRKVMEKD